MQSKVESIINLKTKGGINDIGKRFSRLKRSLNAGSINVTFTRKEDGKVLKPHRKLNMLLALSYYVTVNRKAMQEEVQKMKRRYGNKTK